MLMTPPARKLFFALLILGFFAVAKGAVDFFIQPISSATPSSLMSAATIAKPSAKRPALALPTLLALRFDGSLVGEDGETPVTRPAIEDYQSDANSLTGNTGNASALRLRATTRLSYPSTDNINAKEGTVEVWIKPEWNGNDGLPHTILSFGGNGGLVFGKDGNNLRMVLNRANPNGTLEVDAIASIENWKANDWHHVAASWSNNNKFIRLYIDGSLVSERNLAPQSLPAIDTTANASFDLGGLGFRNPVLSTIDDLVISDTPLPTQTIVNHMTEKLASTDLALTTITPPANASIGMYPGWSSWQDWQYKVRMEKNIAVPVDPPTDPPTFKTVTVFYDLTLPLQAASSISSDNPTVAIFDESSGRIIAKKEGSATITATRSGKTTTISVTVRPAKPSQVIEAGAIYNDPNKPIADALFKIPIVIIRYLPTTDTTNSTLDSTITGLNTSVASLLSKQLNTEKNLKFTLEEGSRFRGYSGAVAKPSLGYSVVKVINIYEEIPPGLPSKTSGKYFPDYKQILQRNDVKLADLINKQGVKEIWLEQYDNGIITLNESNMSSPVTGDISNSLRTNDDLPVYEKPYTVFGINYALGENLATRSRGQHLEAILSYANKRQDGNDTLFTDLFIGRNADNSFQPGRCGKTVRPPNSANDLDFTNLTAVTSDIQDWYPDGSGIPIALTSNKWATELNYSWPAAVPTTKAESQWYIYWMQAMPGAKNGIQDIGFGQMTNWWQFTGDWDGAMKAGVGLYQATSCQFTLANTSQEFFGNGGSGSLNITSGTNCKWFASTSDSWITLTNAIGNGNGAVTFTIDPIPAPLTTRTGTILIAGQTFTVTQSNVACGYSIGTPTLTTLPASGGTGNVAVTAATGCEWGATSDSAWLTTTITAATINAGKGSGNGSVNYKADPNNGPERTGKLTIAGKEVLIKQSIGCTFTVTPATQTIPAAAGTGTVNVTTTGGCAWTASVTAHTPTWLTIPAGTTDNKSGVITFSATANTGAERTASLSVNGQSVSITQSSGCTYSLSASAPPQNIAATGGTGKFTVTTGANCPWTAVVSASAPWLKITQINNEVTFTVDANTGIQRTGIITVADKTFTVTQNSGCTYTLTPANLTPTANGGAASVAVSTSAGCTWNASVAPATTWITLTSAANNTGTGSANFTIAPSTGAARTGVITVAGQNFTINQSANAAPTITAGSALTRQQGAVASVSNLATTSDPETAAASLTVATVTVPTGISITNLTNTNGTISASIAASCLAALGSNTLVLKITDALGASTNANITIDVTAGTSCFLTPAETSIGDQRAGSVLIYNYYTSSLSSPSAQNTQIRITNTNETNDIAVQLYFIDSQTSSPQSIVLCLGANQTTNFSMALFDPGITGYIIAVAVNKTTGCPANFNYLTGGAYVKLSSGHTANLGALAVAALTANPTTCATGNKTAMLNFDGTNYGRLPRMLTIDNIGSVRDGNDLLLAVNRIGGSLLTTVGAVGLVNGKLFDNKRNSRDFTFTGGSSQFSTHFSSAFPRIAGTTFDQFIPSGQSGWAKMWTDNNIGIVGSAINLSANLRTPLGFAGGYNLQVMALTATASLEIPLTTPTCP